MRIWLDVGLGIRAYEGFATDVWACLWGFLEGIRRSYPLIVGDEWTVSASN